MSIIYLMIICGAPSTPAEDLNEGRDVAAGAFTGTLFQSLLGVGEKECR